VRLKLADVGKFYHSTITPTALPAMSRASPFLPSGKFSGMFKSFRLPCRSLACLSYNALAVGLICLPCLHHLVGAGTIESYGTLFIFSIALRNGLDTCLPWRQLSPNRRQHLGRGNRRLTRSMLYARLLPCGVSWWITLLSGLSCWLTIFIAVRNIAKRLVSAWLGDTQRRCHPG